MKLKKYTNKEALSSIQKGFEGYEKIVDKQIHYVYLNKSGRYKELILKPHSRNFLHLCGIDYIASNKRKLNAIQFYQALKNKLVSFQGIRIKDETSHLKFAVLPELKSLTSCKELRIVDKTTVYDKNSFTHAIKTRRKIFALGLEEEKELPHFIPKSLLNAKTLPHIDSGHQVHCIYSIDISSGNRVIICKDPDFITYEQKNSYTYAK